MNKLFQLTVVVLFFLACTPQKIKLCEGEHDLVFTQLANRWDEAVPLGNGMLGALIWQNGDKLRFSLDRADLWDLRPMTNLNTPEWKYKWVYEQWKKNDYRPVQEKFDVPYDQNPAPSKIPAAALEFNVLSLGKIKNTRLSLTDATCEVNWENGARLLTFVHASQPAGWFRFEGIQEPVSPVIVPPAYNLEGEESAANPVSGLDLRRLGYPKGKIETGNNQITYFQEGWGGFKYQVHVNWKQLGKTIEGCWSISSEFPEWEKTASAKETVGSLFAGGFQKAFNEHSQWWNTYFAQSSVSLPDSVLERQWYLEQYKFGSVARKGAPPISLQAVWTADNGKLPPWKGDFHHDLNTQLSYWPAYSANHLDLEEGFIEWLWKYRDTFKRYTKAYFGTNGLNVPGVSTLTGAPMGGWIQYAFGPTVSSWLAQHFYLHWRYSMDRSFLEEKAYPWISEVAIYLDELSVKDDTGKRKLPISSSPEINNNSRDAWFEQTTNYDLALIHWTYQKAAELALELGKTDEANKWKQIESEWPGFIIDEKEGLKFATTLGYHQSHRHFSHLMAIHPLGLIDWSGGEPNQTVIGNTLSQLEKIGPDYYCGYSYSWKGNLYARARDGEKAAESLRIFSTAFCLPNSFHVNGDQSGKGYSKLTYRPFTLEGNFACAAGIQEMLLQSHTGIVQLFPAIPASWKDVSFNQLRAEGAFLISAEKKNGKLAKLVIQSEKGGNIRIQNTFDEQKFTCPRTDIQQGELITINMKPGESIELQTL